MSYNYIRFCIQLGHGYPSDLPNFFSQHNYVETKMANQRLLGGDTATADQRLALHIDFATDLINRCVQESSIQSDYLRRS